ncbi:MAG: DUF1330 domain-containing protein [Beijerinckiaceae bacterium]
MAKGYWIAHNDVSDPETYEKYKAATGAVFQKFGANFLVRGGRYKGLQGPVRSRHVVIEFESYEKALECYNSPEYQEAAKHRLGASEGEIVICEGP